MAASTVIVHDWLTGMRGGERLLLRLLDAVPSAEIATLVHCPEAVDPAISSRVAQTSFLQRSADRFQKNRVPFLPLLPLAARSLDLSDYDLVISISHCVAKAVRTRSDQHHICYCLTPLRYAWDRFEDYAAPSGPRRWLQSLGAAALRIWDRSTAHRPDEIWSISRFVSRRIRRCWGRRADRLIYPPVEWERMALGPGGDRYLVLSALVPHKRIDLAIRAVTRVGGRLDVIGDGPLREELEASAPPNVRFLGWCSDAEVRRRLGRARALIFPGVDEFGITAVEAQAAGRPVIGRSEGGLSETVVPHGRPEATGILYAGDAVSDLVKAIERFETVEKAFEPEAARRNARRFSARRFVNEVEGALRQQEARRSSAPPTVTV